MNRLRGLYLVTPDWTDTRALADAVEPLLDAGVAMLQYRNKLADAGLRREQAAMLARLCERADVPLIINDDPRLAADVAAAGVHVGRDDGDLAAAREIVGASAIVGVTCYDDFGRAAALSAAGADYVAFGAMFASPTKPQAVSAPIELLSRARDELAVPVAAIGGITAENAPLLIDAGADLLAVISDVFAAVDPCARVAQYRSAFAQAN
ncbi:MAG: thiamine phosphate synthase [Rhodocyclaceae bacterium]